MLNLREMRQASGKSLTEIANKVGVDVGHLSRIERGYPTHPASSMLLAKLAKALRHTYKAAVSAYVRTINQAHGVRCSTLDDVSILMSKKRTPTGESNARKTSRARDARRRKAASAR